MKGKGHVAIRFEQGSRECGRGQARCSEAVAESAIKHETRAVTTKHKPAARQQRVAHLALPFSGKCRCSAQPIQRSHLQVSDCECQLGSTEIHVHIDMDDGTHSHSINHIPNHSRTSCTQLLLTLGEDAVAGEG